MSLSNIFDFDIYAKGVGVFYDGKEKISSFLGKILTSIYIFTYLSLFLYYTIYAVKKTNYKVYDSTIYSDEIPSINITNNDLYIAFGVENPNTTERFVDETIYTVKVIFYDAVREKNGWFTEKKIYLPVSKCNLKYFGNEYQHYFYEDQLNNSYCIDNINLTLTGGFKYNKMSYIKILIYPCVNKTENNFHCKPQNIIDEYLDGTYFSLITKDIGLVPSNFTSPITPILQDLFFTIGKYFYKDYILYFGITEVQTDSGFYFNEVNKKRYLQFNKESKNFYLREESDYYNGKSICQIQIRLSDNIHVQKRVYFKISEAFGTIGGYVQLINTIFIILSLVPNKINAEKILVNHLFSFDLNKKKITISIKYKNRYNYYYIGNKFNSISDNILVQNYNRMNENNVSTVPFTNLNKDENTQNKNKRQTSANVNNILQSKNNKLNINNCHIKNKKLSPNLFAQKNLSSKFKKSVSTFGNNILLNNSDNSFFINKLKFLELSRKGRKSDFVISNKHIENEDDKENIIKRIKFNIFEYLCLRQCVKKNNANIILFDESSLFFRNQLDVINIFNSLMLFREIYRDESQNIKKKEFLEEIEFELPDNIWNELKNQFII